MHQLLTFFFHHLYHSLAWSYDLVAAIVSVGRWQAWGLTALPYLRGRRVLELGFGPGHLQVEMRRRKIQAIGLDESPQMIRQARQNLSRNELPAGLLRGYAQSLPFQTESFDSVLATFPSEYIAAPETLAEVRRVLRDDGRLIIVPGAAFTGKSILDRLADWLFMVTGQSQPTTEPFAARLKARLTAAGFSVGLEHVEIRQSVVLVIVAEKMTGEATANSPTKME